MLKMLLKLLTSKLFLLLSLVILVISIVAYLGYLDAPVIGDKVITQDFLSNEQLEIVKKGERPSYAGVLRVNNTKGEKSVLPPDERRIEYREEIGMDQLFAGGYINVKYYVDKTIYGGDRYKVDVLKVEIIEGNFAVLLVVNSPLILKNITIDMNEVEFQPLSSEFVALAGAGINHER